VLRRNFGITPDDYDKMLHDQGGGCAICHEPPRAMRLAVDHCHDSGSVRGLLCNLCNRGIGALKDDPTILARAIQYLEESKSK
jgi:hypothetical protein